MIRHVVLINFRPELDEPAVSRALHSVVKLKDRIEGILAVTVGANNSPENVEKGFRHGFVVDFRDAAARDAYLPHPEHVKVGKALVEAAQGGIQGILVFDYEV
ncbi:MAG: Dabb family protein [Pseudomonadota bacterium]